MVDHLTSFAGLFSSGGTDDATVTGIEIPLIQRDYAQGRTDGRTTEIRERFLEAIHDALAGGEKLGLDFVYGDVDGGTLRPLDGQQRLTTLFLLHWYLGYRAGQLAEPAPWMNFSYATRPSARLFCQRLVRAEAPPDEADPAAWIIDQAWYLHVWRHDPTIQAMLEMIRALHRRFEDCDADVAWARLVSPDDPAISFQLLPIDGMGSGEELYITMNSRGKPLTAFENFKARFENSISWAEERATTFGERVDGAWSDILWRIRGANDIVDDEFMRYIAFVTDVCEWRLGRIPNRHSTEKRALSLFGTEGPNAERCLDFLFHAFDTWNGTDIKDEFRRIFTSVPNSGDHVPRPLLLFGETDVNLFDACCRDYDSRYRGQFSYGRTLLLFAVIVSRADPSDDLPRRLRVLRNLIEASENEFRPNRLPAMVADVQQIVVHGSLERIKGFNSAQAEDERAKWAFLDAHPQLAPALYRLEDHRLLRGSLQAFALDANTFEQRATAFESVMATPSRRHALTAALLAAGEYASRRNPRDLQFGAPSNEEPWRKLLTESTRANLAATEAAMGTVLDAVAADEAPDASLKEARDAFIREREHTRNFDWRYYLVRYDVMRDGASGIYASTGGAMGYRLCMLERTQMNGRYRDPYLTALVHQAGASRSVDDGERGPFFRGGHVEDTRSLRLRISGTGMHCSADGFVLRPPREDFLQRFEEICANFGLDERLKLVIEQRMLDNRLVDTNDRIQAGAVLLRELVAAGL